MVIDVLRCDHQMTPDRQQAFEAVLQRGHLPDSVPRADQYYFVPLLLAITIIYVFEFYDPANSEKKPIMHTTSFLIPHSSWSFASH